MDKLRPPFPYFGAKQTLAARIVELLPPHDHYVEPFAGSLAVLLAKPRSTMETVNDLDGDLMHLWRVIRERPDDLARVCALTPHSRAEHERTYSAEPAADDLERARRTWIKLTQGRGGSLRITGWRYFQDPRGGRIGMPGYLAGYVDRIAPCAGRLAGVSLECRPALELIENYGRHEGVLLYVDPPYLGSTRSSRQYAHEMSHEPEHRELAEALKSCRASVVLSGYESPLYAQLYADWDRVEFDAFTGQANTAGRRTEVLWANCTISDPHLFSDSVDDTATVP